VGVVINLIRPSVELIGTVNGDKILEKLELYGRVCYKSEDRIEPGTAKKFIKRIVDSGHESVIEHEHISARVICDRGVSHEIVRHRIGSYSQESTRYCNYGTKGLTFVIPPWVTSFSPGTYGYEELHQKAIFLLRRTETGEQNKQYLNERIWSRSIWTAALDYHQLLENGWTPQQARAVLPNSLKTELIITYNLRQWRHFLKLRCSPNAHPQMREIALMLLWNLRQEIPVLFDDIEYKGEGED